MRIRRADRRMHFTVLDNALLEDVRLSYRARGVLAYLLSKPDGWVTDHHKISAAGKEGERAVRTALAELVAVGYITRRRIRDPKTCYWTTETEVHEHPRVAVPATRKPATRKPATRKPATSNKYGQQPLTASTDSANPNPGLGQESEVDWPDLPDSFA